MCTGFIKKGNDLLFGFNLDIDPTVWNFKLFKTNDYFTIGIKVGTTLYFTHGVNKQGHFGNLPYMNAPEIGKYHRGKNDFRIDLLNDRYIKNLYSFEEVKAILQTKNLVNAPNCSMHSLIGDKEGHILLVEPGFGYQEVEENFAVITNFPLFKNVEKNNPWFGIDRYDKATKILKASSPSFGPLDGLELLKQVKQEGPWATRVSFVYSKNEHCVYYVLNNDFNSIQKHVLGK